MMSHGHRQLKEDDDGEVQSSGAVKVYGTATGTAGDKQISPLGGAAAARSGTGSSSDPSSTAAAGGGGGSSTDHHVTDSSALLDEHVAHDDRYPLDTEYGRLYRGRGGVGDICKECCDWSKPCGSWLKHPKVKEQWKVVLASFVLTVLGLALIVAGFVFTALPDTNVSSYVFLITGFICFIPGAYHFIYIYLAVTGRCGLSMYNMPVFK